jgi:hypothetical protein
MTDQEPGTKKPVGDEPPDEGRDKPVGDEAPDKEVPPVGDEKQKQNEDKRFA